MAGNNATPAVLNTSAYVFCVFEESELPKIKERIVTLTKPFKGRLCGTFYVTPEGLNIFLTGDPEAVTHVRDQLPVSVDSKLTGIDYKDSWSAEMTQRKMLVKIRKEIIALGDANIRPAEEGLAAHIEPEEFKEWIEAEKDMLILDTRNDYEVRVGTFTGALDLGIKSFRAFPAACAAQLADVARDKPVVMFCTGGVRCEKAAYTLQQQGFTHVSQLHGGIIRYFERCGGTGWDGECYTFDRRVTLTPQLTRGSYTMCYACRAPLTAEEAAAAVTEGANGASGGLSCPHCVGGKNDFRSVVATELASGGNGPAAAAAAAATAAAAAAAADTTDDASAAAAPADDEGAGAALRGEGGKECEAASLS